MKFPAELKYTKDHEWAKIDGSNITVGITDHAQRALGDIVYVEVPAVGKQLKKGDAFGVVESIKAVSDLYSPVSGKVTAANSALGDDPSQVNKDAYASWMVKIEATEIPGDLMDSGAYEKYVAQLK